MLLGAWCLVCVSACLLLACESSAELETLFKRPSENFQVRLFAPACLQTHLSKLQMERKTYIFSK